MRKEIPFGGEGESAAALRTLFSNLPNNIRQDANKLTDLVQGWTAIFSEVMRYRIALTQLTSDCIPFNPQDEYMVASRKKLEDLWAEEGIECPPGDYPPFGPDVTEVLYRHNIVERTKKFMKTHGLEVPAYLHT